MSTHLLKTLAVTAALLAAPAATLHAQGAGSAPGDIQTGLWDYKTKIAGLTVDSEARCVDAADVDKFFDGPCNRHHTCVYPIRVIGNGKAKFEGYWQNKKGQRANVSASGDYTPTRFTLVTKPTRGTNGVPIPSLTLEAKRIAATCPPGAKQVK